MDHHASLAGGADWLWMAGRVEGAITAQQELLSARKRVLGPDHPDTLAARDVLALMQRKARPQVSLDTLVRALLDMPTAAAQATLEREIGGMGFAELSKLYASLNNHFLGPRGLHVAPLLSTISHRLTALAMAPMAASPPSFHATQRRKDGIDLSEQAMNLNKQWQHGQDILRWNADLGVLKLKSLMWS